MHGSFRKADVGFGVTQNGSYMVGALENEPQARELHVQDFVTGLGGWLVYKGEKVVEDSTEDRAPRTAIGVDRMGRLILLVADGAEHWYVEKIGRDSDTTADGEHF